MAHLLAAEQTLFDRKDNASQGDIVKNSIQILFVTLSVIFFMQSSNAQVIQTDSTNKYSVLSLVISSDGLKLIAGTNGAGIFYSTNNGKNWIDANQTLGGLFVHSLVINDTIIFAGTDQGVYITSSINFGGASWYGWSAVNSGLADKNILSLVISGDGTILYTGTSNGVFRSSNNGTSWTAINTGLVSTYINALAVSDTYLFAGTLCGVYRSTNSGSNWESVNTGLTNSSVFALSAKSDQTGGSDLFAGTDDGIFISSDLGASWNTANTGLTNTDVNCLASTGSHLYLGTFDGGVFQSSSNGANWNEVNLDLTDVFVHALAISGSDLFIGTSASFGVLYNTSTLPVELTAFTISVNRNAVSLQWNTASELNNYGFEIQRSAKNVEQVMGQRQNIDESNWMTIGFIEGHGSTNMPQSYSFVDNSASGTVSYRLKQIDQDGKINYSQELNGIVSAPQIFTLSQNYPNPFNPTTELEFTIPINGVVTLKVYNGVGQEVSILFSGMAEAGKYHHVRFNAAGLASGMYFSRLEYDGKVQVKRMMLIK